MYCVVVSAYLYDYEGYADVKQEVIGPFKDLRTANSVVRSLDILKVFPDYDEWKELAEEISASAIKMIEASVE